MELLHHDWEYALVNSSLKLSREYRRKGWVKWVLTRRTLNEASCRPWHFFKLSINLAWCGSDMNESWLCLFRECIRDERRLFFNCSKSSKERESIFHIKELYSVHIVYMVLYMIWSRIISVRSRRLPFSMYRNRSLKEWIECGMLACVSELRTKSHKGDIWGHDHIWCSIVLCTLWLQ